MGAELSLKGLYLGECDDMRGVDDQDGAAVLDVAEDLGRPRPIAEAIPAGRAGDTDERFDPAAVRQQDRDRAPGRHRVVRVPPRLVVEDFRRNQV